MTTPGTEKLLVFVGTYTRRGSEGIYVYRMDGSSGALEFASKATGIVDPSFLAIDPRQRNLYAVNEIDEFGGKASGAVTAYSIDQRTGDLTMLNQQPTLGTGPCNLVVDATGKFVIVANYQGGSVCVLPIQDDGSLGEATDFVQHEGSSIDPNRQQEPHAHSVTLDPANRYLIVADLGIDKLMVYRLDLDQGKLLPNDPPSTSVEPGAGPRHFEFHPNGRIAYLINEIGNTVTSYNYDAQRGALTEIATVPTLPADYSETSHTADIHVSPSGEFVYGSNRGHDSIAIFRTDGDTGKLAFVGHQSTQGEVPRNFAIDPTGTFLLAANQNTDTIVTFRIDGRTGELSPTGEVTQVPAPVCIKMIPAFA